jgi:hypothetical protein
MLYLYVNETYIKKPTNPIKVDGVSYSNPTNKTLLSLGYLPLEENEALPDKAGYWVSPKYRKETDKIVNEWQYVEVVEDEFA